MLQGRLSGQVWSDRQAHEQTPSTYLLCNRGVSRDYLTIKSAPYLA